jgi:hypothetical protein
MKPSDILRNLLLSCAGIFLALLLVEIPAMLNVVDYRSITWLSPDRFDPELRTIHRPYSLVHGAAMGGLAATMYRIPRSEMLPYEWDVKYDAHGFRNSTDLERADIVVVGGSFVEGMTVPSASLMTNLLSQETGTAVANLGQNNFAPQQDLIALRKYGLPLRPRTVIWMYTDFNDLRMVLFYRGAAARPSSPWEGFRDRSFSSFAWGKLAPYFAIHCPASRFRNCAPPDGELRSGVVPDAQGKLVRVYFTHPPVPMDQIRLLALGYMRATFAEAYKLTAAQGARFIVVFIPESFRVFQPLATFPANSLSRRWVLSDEPERVEATLRSISPDIGFLDLTPAMRQAVRQGIIPYFKDDNHWSPAGQQLAARVIGDYLSHTRPESAESSRSQQPVAEVRSRTN